MNKRLAKFLQIAIPLALGVFLIWYSYTKFTPQQLDEIQTHFKEANYGFVALSVFFGVLSNLSRAYRWNYMLAPLGFKPHFKNNIMAIYITYLMNLFIPRSGEVSRALVIHKYENVPFDKAFGTIVSERVADFVILLALIATALFLQFPLVSGYLSETIPMQKIYLGIGILIPVMILFFWFIQKSKSSFSRKIRQFLSGLKEGVFAIFKMQKKWAFLGHTLFIWVMYLSMFYVMVFALDQTSGISMAAILTSFVVGSITIAFTNSGFGSYPFFLAGILLLFDVPETAGTAFGWLVWSSQTLMVILLGGLSFLLLPMLNKTK